MSALYREATKNEAMRWKESGARIMSGIPVEIDHENPAAYLHATIWGLLGDREAEDSMPTRDQIRHWVEGIIELGIGGDDE